MRTKQEIQDEIKSLKALKPVGRFQRETAAKIALAIEELEDGVDVTTDEFQDLSDDAKDTISQTNLWKEGLSRSRPSEGWGGLVQD